MIHKLYIIFQDFQKQMNRKNIGSFAASTAFFLFLSLVPMLIMLCTIIPFTRLTEENLLQAVTELVPETLTPLLTSLIADVYDKSAGVLSLAAIATLWSAGKGMLALIRGLNEVNEVEENRNYFLLRTVASLYTLVLLLVVLMSLLVNVFGNVLLDMISARIPQARVLFDFFMHFRFLAVWLLLTVLFTAIYTYVPNKKLKFGMQIPGAVFSAVVWSIFSWGFAIYVESGSGFHIYGSLSLIIMIMLWLYFCIYIILIGAQINRYFGPAYRVVYRNRREKRKKG